MQLTGSDQDAIHALEGHPNVKRVTSHKMVTRTLKYVSVEESDNVANNDDDAGLQDTQDHNIHRRSLSLVSG